MLRRQEGGGCLLHPPTCLPAWQSRQPLAGVAAHPREGNVSAPTGIAPARLPSHPTALLLQGVVCSGLTGKGVMGRGWSRGGTDAEMPWEGVFCSALAHRLTAWSILGGKPGVKAPAALRFLHRQLQPPQLH